MTDKRNFISEALRTEPLTRDVDPIEEARKKEKRDRLINNSEAFDQAVENMGRYNTLIPNKEEWE